MKQFIITVVVEAESELKAMDFAKHMLLPTRYELDLAKITFNTANLREAGKPVSKSWPDAMFLQEN